MNFKVEEWDDENESFEVIWAMCTTCGKAKRMSFFIGDKYRLTWCMRCGRAVEWVRLYGPRNKTINDKGVVLQQGEPIEEM